MSPHGSWHGMCRTIPARPPFNQRPFRRTEVRWSQTKERPRGTTHSNEEPSSYSIHSKALNNLPALRAGRRQLSSGATWVQIQCGQIRTHANIMFNMINLPG